MSGRLFFANVGTGAYVGFTALAVGLSMVIAKAHRAWRLADRAATRAAAIATGAAAVSVAALIIGTVIYGTEALKGLGILKAIGIGVVWLAYLAVITAPITVPFMLFRRGRRRLAVWFIVVVWIGLILWALIALSLGTMSRFA
jgi:hypothetical protein